MRYSEKESKDFCEFAQSHFSSTAMVENWFKDFLTKEDRIKQAIKSSLKVDTFYSKRFIYFFGDDEDDRFKSYSMELLSQGNDFFFRFDFSIAEFHSLETKMQDMLLDYMASYRFDFCGNNYLQVKIEHIDQDSGLCLKIFTFLDFFNFLIERNQS